MGTFIKNFTLLRFFRSLTTENTFISFLQTILTLFAVCFMFVTGTGAGDTSTFGIQELQEGHESFNYENLKQHELIAKSDHSRGSIWEHPFPSDFEDAKLPSAFPKMFNDDKEAFNPSHNHILTKRQVQFPVQNDFERLYLCVFTLFSNPNCRLPVQSQSHTHSATPEHTQQQHGNGFVGVLPQNGQRLGLFGLGNGIFGGRFGLSPQTNFVSYNPYGNHGNTQSHLSVIHQTPYPEQQVNRRPGPAFVTTAIATSTTTTPTTTTARASSTTVKPLHSKTSTVATTQRYYSPPPTTRRLTATTPRSFRTTTTKQPQFPGNVESAINFGDSNDCGNRTEPELGDEKASKPKPKPKPTSKTTTTTSTTAKPAPICTCAPCPQIPLSPNPTVPVQLPVQQQQQWLTKENSELKTELENSRKDVQTYQQQNKYLQEALSTLQSDNLKHKARVSQLERTNDHLQQQNGQLQHSVGDQRTQLNELRSKIKYIEEKLVRLSRQSIEDQKQVTKLQNRVRDLNQENGECKSQIYQLQLRSTQKIVHEAATSVEMEMKGHLGGHGRYPTHEYRDDFSTSTEQLSAGQKIIFDTDDGSSATTIGNDAGSDEITGTTMNPEENPTETKTVDEVTTLPSIVASTDKTTAPTTTTTSSTTRPITTTTRTIEHQEQQAYEPIFSSSFAHHPGIIFDEGEDEGPLHEGEDDSNEFSVFVQDPEKTFDYPGIFGEHVYTPAHLNALNSLSRGAINHHPFDSSYWNVPYEGLMGQDGSKNEQN